MSAYGEKNGYRLVTQSCSYCGLQAIKQLNLKDISEGKQGRKQEICDPKSQIRAERLLRPINHSHTSVIISHGMKNLREKLLSTGSEFSSGMERSLIASLMRTVCLWKDLRGGLRKGRITSCIINRRWISETNSDTVKLTLQLPYLTPGSNRRMHTFSELNPADTKLYGNSPFFMYWLEI